MSSSTSPLANQARPCVLARVLPATLLAMLAGAPVGFAQVDGDLRDPMSSDVVGLADGVNVDENLVVDLHVNDEDLSNVLQMLSIQSQRNIVTSKSVSATVTANLYSVTFFEALDAILHVNGYGYIEEGNFIYVYTTEELMELMEQNRQRAWKVIKLNYLNAIDAAEFVKPLLSEGGQIKTNGASGEFINATLPTGADQFANEATMVISDYPEIIDEIENLLAELDTRPAQILIEATILQTSIDEQNAFGVDFSVIGSLDFFDFATSGPLSVVDKLIGGSSTGLTSSGVATVNPQPTGGEGGGIVSNPGNTAGPATFKGGFVNGDVAVFIRLLDQVTDTTILSRPNILTLNRQPARVLVGEKVGYLNTTSTDTATTQTVEFLDTGTQLYVRPFVSTEGTIRMELKPQVSEASIRDATDVTGAIVTIPDELTNELVANVMVRDGQTVVLGGLFRDNTKLTRRQVPFAGDIPIIGAAFRGHDDTVDRSEIIFMIKPSIVSDDVLIDQGERARAVAERAYAGARDGLLPWSRKRRSAQLLVEANRLVELGKYNQALHCVRRALALDSTNVEAMTIRDKIRGKSPEGTDSYLEEIITGDLQEFLDKHVAPEDERARNGNVRGGWIKPETVVEQDDDDWQPDDQGDDVEPVDDQTEQDTVAEVTDPLSDAGDTEPDDLHVDDAQTHPVADIARSNREQATPEERATVAEQLAQDTTDWKSLQDQIRAEAERANEVGAWQDDSNGDLAVVEPATKTGPAPQRTEGYRYTESEDAVIDMLDQVVGLGAAVQTAGHEVPDTTITLNVSDADVTTVIDMVAQLSGREVISAPNVTGTVTVSLEESTFDEAMKSIARSANLGTLVHDDATYLFRTDEVDPTSKKTPHWVWKAVELQHIQAEEVLSEARRLVSSDGQAETEKSIPHDAPFNADQFYGKSAIIVFDLLANAEQLVWIMEDIDAREGERRQRRTNQSALKAGNNDPAVVGKVADVDEDH